MHSNSATWALSSSREFFFPSSVSTLALMSNGVTKAATFGLEALEGVERYEDDWKHNKQKIFWFYLYLYLIIHLSSKDFLRQGDE